MMRHYWVHTDDLETQPGLVNDMAELGTVLDFWTEDDPHYLHVIVQQH